MYGCLNKMHTGLDALFQRINIWIVCCRMYDSRNLHGKEEQKYFQLKKIHTISGQRIKGYLFILSNKASCCFLHLK